MVTDGLPTVRTQREDTAQPYASDGNYTRHTQTKPSTCYNNPRETTQKQPDTTKPPPQSSITSHSLPTCPQEPLQHWEDLRRRFQTILHDEGSNDYLPALASCGNPTEPNSRHFLQ